jgi:hypothetical protein
MFSLGNWPRESPIPSFPCDTEEYRQESPLDRRSASLPERPLIAEKRPPQFVGYFDLDPELSLCVVIPFAHVRDSRKNHREREDDQPS